MPRHGRLVLRWLAYGIVGAALCLVSLLPFILLQSETRSAHHQDKAVLPARGADEDDVVHIVFSTDCSGYQHWQSIALWYAAQSAGHPGPVTRVASGCSQDEDMRLIADEFSRIDGGRNRFRAHFTPSMQLQGDHQPNSLSKLAQLFQGARMWRRISLYAYFRCRRQEEIRGRTRLLGAYRKLEEHC